ncbi:replication-relaxation family protein [Cohnella yongneupensis]|uniref:Replication-relaxation family protein n=1 Tax=Cohnella yongneupensis TaxID=425006 RepID=A0ABW0R6X1_9BACL
MTLFHSNWMPAKQKIIVKILFEYRGLLYEQLIEELSQRFTGRPASQSFTKNTYKDLQKLEEQRLIIRDPIKIGRTKDLIYLSEAGHEYAAELFGIYPGHVGTGWDRDYGDFPHELQRPPKASSPVILHHLMAASVLLRLERLKHSYPDYEIDYRDNRYASLKYDTDGTVNRFKPDGELLIRSGRYLLEMDRGTEFGEKLREKFQTYRRYLEHLQESGESLPEGVIFVCNKDSYNGMLKRWNLISSIFWSELGEWRTRFNLIGINGVTELERVVVRQGERDKQFNAFYSKMARYRSAEVNFGIINSGQGLDWDRPVFSLSSSTPDRMLAYERVEQFETLGLARLYAWSQWLSSARGRYPNLTDVTRFIPVLVRTDSKPAPLIFKGFDTEAELTAIFSSALWLNTLDEPRWRDPGGEPLSLMNPIE